MLSAIFALAHALSSFVSQVLARKQLALLTLTQNDGST
jgi:hypothetical protein